MKLGVRGLMDLLVFFAEFPVFPHHFSIRTTSPPFLHCIAINQPRDRDWGSKYLCYKPALKKLNITWSPKGKVIGQDCLNTAMPYEPSARLWANSFLCISRDSLLKLSWSLSGPLNGQECLLVREPTRGYGKGYFLCARTKYKKIGKDNSFCRTVHSRGQSVFKLYEGMQTMLTSKKLKHLGKT